MSETQSPAVKRTRPQLWVSSTYFAEGFPYSLVNNVVEIMFEQLGASLKLIGMTSLFHLPWNLKFLWGPLVDQYETKRRWLLGVEIALSLSILVLAALVGTIDGISQALVVSVLFLAFLSATHDIAIDGFYLEVLDEKEQSAYVGWRATFYRIAGIALGGPLLWFIGRAGWFAGMLLMATMMVGLSAYHFFVLPRVETRRKPIATLVNAILRPRLLLLSGAIALAILLGRHFSVLAHGAGLLRQVPLLAALSFSDWVVVAFLLALTLGVILSRARSGPRAKTTEPSPYLSSFTSFMDQRNAALVLAFVVLFRTGESFLTKMRWPFLHKVAGMQLEEYAIVNGTIGVFASFGATLLGGWLISKHGLRRCIWPFVLAQNVLNLLYMFVGFSDDPAQLPALTLASVIAVEHAGGGLGTAVFMVFLMRCCDPAHRASHMAILTALMSVSFTIAGLVSGYLAEAVGFANYFGLTFVFTIPSMILIPLLPYLDGRATPPVSES